MEVPLISVIVPVFNAGAFLKQCLNSLLNQLYMNYEVILVDDGSNDGSEKQCDIYAERYNNIFRVIHQKNGGPGAARNAGLDAAKGEYLCFVDADDVVSDHFLEHLACLWQSVDVDMITCCSTSEIDRLDTYQGESEIISARFALDCILDGEHFDGYLWNKLFSRRIIETNHIRFDRSIFIWEDMLFCVQYLKHVKEILRTNEVLYFYRINSTGLTSKTSLKKKKEQVNACILLLKESDIPRSKYDQDAQKYLVKQRLIYARHLLLEKKTDIQEVKDQLEKTASYINNEGIPVKQKLKYYYLKMLTIFFACSMFCMTLEK